jgi:hypothetical protein
MFTKIMLILLILFVLLKWSSCATADYGQVYLQVVTFPPAMVTLGIASIPGDSTVSESVQPLPNYPYRR